MDNRKDDVILAVEEIIKRLYRKDGKVNQRMLKKHGLWNEAINWGDLHCLEVYRKGRSKTWIVVIEEASPYCKELCNYIKDCLAERGVLADVRTEW